MPRTQCLHNAAQLATAAATVPYHLCDGDAILMGYWLKKWCKSIEINNVKRFYVTD